MFNLKNELLWVNPSIRFRDFRDILALYIIIYIYIYIIIFPTLGCFWKVFYHTKIIINIKYFLLYL